MSPTARRYFGCFLPSILAVLGCGASLMTAYAGRAVVQYVTVTDGAMAPVLAAGHRALVFYTMIWASEPAVGVVAEIDSPEGRVFRRIVGGPGQTVAIVDGALVVDGVAGDPAARATGAMADMAPLALGAEAYFVLADDRAYPDSRAWGPIDRAAIFGEPIFYDDGTELLPFDSGTAAAWRRGRRR